MFYFGSKLPVFVVFMLISSISWGYSGGDGSLANPWGISSADDLLELSSDTANYDKHFVLTGDIDLGLDNSALIIFPCALIAADCNELSYGFQGDAFTGVFDGNGHTISNFTYTSTGCVGLFGYIDHPNTHIKDLGLIDPSVESETGIDTIFTAKITFLRYFQTQNFESCAEFLLNFITC